MMHQSECQERGIEKGKKRVLGRRFQGLGEMEVIERVLGQRFWAGWGVWGIVEQVRRQFRGGELCL